MKTRFLFSSILLLLCAMFSCEEDGTRIDIKDDVTANELDELSSASYVLDRADAEVAFEEFTWSAPDFGFAAGGNYTLQIDLKGNDFASPVTMFTTSELSGSVTVGELNKFLMDLGVAPEEATAVEFRVVTVVNDNVDPIYSTPRSVTITPYATSFPPIYMIGDATGGWDLAKAVGIRSIAPSKYETVAEFTNGGKFRFFATASWDAAQYNWNSFNTADTELVNAGDGDSNFYFDGASGWYKITVDLKAKTIVLTPTDKPQLFMIGAAIEGWDLDKAVELTRLGDGLFMATTNFTSGETFRFFTKKDWGAGTINYPYFDGGAVDELFENANDGDSNFKFVGATGAYTITVDLNSLTITMD